MYIIKIFCEIKTMTTLWLTLWCKSYIRSCKQVTLEAVSMQVLPSAVAALVHYAFEHKFLLQIATWKYTFISNLFTNIFKSTYNNQWFFYIGLRINNISSLSKYKKKHKFGVSSLLKDVKKKQQIMDLVTLQLSKFLCSTVR